MYSLELYIFVKFILAIYVQLNNACFIFVIDVMSYNSINLILIPNKLTKPNYLDWKRNMEIIPI